MDDWRLLDLQNDPVPGDPNAIRRTATRLRREAEAWQRLATRLRTISTNSGRLGMRGDYAPRYRDALAELPTPPNRLAKAQRLCGEALSAYAAELERAQAQARNALNAGRQANERYHAVLRMFYSVVPVRYSGDGTWRGLTEQTAWNLSAALQLSHRQYAVQLGAQGRQAEEARQQARQQAVNAGTEREAAATRCASGIQNALAGIELARMREGAEHLVVLNEANIPHRLPDTDPRGTAEWLLNARRRIDPKGIRGAPPPIPGGRPGHADSKHGVSRIVQADILNRPDRVFSGTYHGMYKGRKYTREVDVYYRDNSVVITEQGKKDSVITAYGLIDRKRERPVPVDPDEVWTVDPRYVEIDIDKWRVAYPVERPTRDEEDAG